MVEKFVVDAFSLGIQAGFAVHEEPVVMFAGGQVELEFPDSIGHPLHWVRRGIPVVEVAAKKDGLGVGRFVGKVDVR